MFEMRPKWIPAYFRHEPMSGLMRTTSRSESENHFLGQITNSYLSLIEFLSHYDTAIDSQRYIYGKNTHNSNYKNPDLKTHLVIEQEAATFYTHTIFYDVQDEIWSSLMHCCSLSVQESDSCSTFVIRDTDADYRIKGSWVQAKYDVTINIQHSIFLYFTNVIKTASSSNFVNFPFNPFTRLRMYLIHAQLSALV